MNIKRIVILVLVIVLILVGSISFKWNKKAPVVSTSDKVSMKVDINGSILNVTYLEGNKIDTKVSFGNKVSKTLKIENKTKEDIAYAICLSEMMFSNDDILYKVYLSEDNKVFKEINDYAVIDNNATLAYNLVVEANQEVYVNVELKANKENEETKMKSIVNVVSNLSEREKIISAINKVMEVVNKKIDDLNGISTSGIYLIDINSIDKNYNGYILIDALDIANIKKYLYVYNEIYMINKVEFSDLRKSSIKEKDNTIFTEYEICKSYSNKECNNFNVLSYNETGGIKDFIVKTKDLYTVVKNNFKGTEKKVYVLNASSVKANIRGYILVNNTLKVPEFYLYLTDDTYMISGYNITKLGDYDTESGTIRSYNEPLFNVSAKDMNTVCNFSGFKDCIDSNNNLIK